ncbi:putative membrane transport domain protein [Bordetella holmesii 44057]|nr:putative membrane transport domain protein [Bordetella holmesii 44057]
MFYGVQSLWVRPYLTDVNMLPAAPAAALVSLLGFAMMGGNVGLGAMARRVERMGLGLYGFSGVCLALFILIQLLIVLRAPVPLALLWRVTACSVRPISWCSPCWRASFRANCWGAWPRPPIC